MFGDANSVLFNFRTKTRWMWANCVWWTLQAVSAPTEPEQRVAVSVKRVSSCVEFLVPCIYRVCMIRYWVSHVMSHPQVILTSPWWHCAHVLKYYVKTRCVELIRLVFYNPYMIFNCCCFVLSHNNTNIHLLEAAVSPFVSSRWCHTGTPKLHTCLKTTLMEKERSGWLCVSTRRPMTMKKLW